MYNASIVFDHRNRAASGEPAPVEIRLTIDRKPYYVNTGIRALRKNFIGGTIIDRADADLLNERLQIIYRKVQEEVNRCIDEGIPIDIARIRRKAYTAGEAAKREGSALVDFIEEQEAMMQLKDGTLKHYRTLRLRLQEYGQLTRWADITAENICRFDAWLHTRTITPSDVASKTGEPPRLLTDAGVWNYHKCLRAVLNRAVLFDRIDANPYDRLHGKFRRGEKESVEYLTNEEIAAVESLQPLQGTLMAAARDLFVFQMHTGLSYADTQAFNFREYTKVNGRWTNVGHRIKTGVQYIVQLSAECERILEKYHWQLPKIGNADYNQCLKALGAAVGIEKRMHSHLARHTFATRMAASGAPIQNVARMLGHASVTQTQRYAKVLPGSVFADFDRLDAIGKPSPKGGNA